MGTGGKIICLTIIFSFVFFSNKAQNLKSKNNLIKTDKVWVFILAGQSNMAGRGKIEAQDTVTSERILSINEKGELILAREPVHFYEPRMKGTGCGLAFGKELLEYIPDDVTILLIPTAVGGSSIDQWIRNSVHRGVPLLSNFREKAELGKQYGEVKAILWHQGESDAKPEGIKHRQEKLKQLFTDFRNTVGNPNLPILMGELGSYSKDSVNWAQMNEQIRLYASSDPYTSVVSTSDFVHRGDFVHFNSAGQREMGKRFAREYLRKFYPKAGKTAVDLSSSDAVKSVSKASPIMGWASWNNFRIKINEDIIKSQADAMVSTGLTRYGYKYINIDDGFFGGRDENGNLLYHKIRFPNGMKNLALYIHGKGLKAGIYSDAGINTCGSKYDKDTIGAGVGLYGHDEQDLQLFLKDWDFDFIKVDWCGGKWLGVDEQTRYTQIGEIARKIKPAVVYNVCRWEFPGKWVTQVADSWRISGDISNKFESILKIIDLNADLWKYASAGHYNDMDMLQVGRGMSFDEDKSHFSMWCLMQSPLLLGNDLTKIKKQTLEIISNEDLISIDQSSYVYQARRILDYGDFEVWGRPLVSTMSGEIVIALLNRTKESGTISFKIDSVGLNPAKGYTIKDLWTKENFPLSYEKEVSRTVPGHGIVVLRIKGVALPYNFFQYDTKK